MVAAIIFAQAWGVIQLLVLTTPARTVRTRTVFAAFAVGFYAIGPLTAFLQLSWIHLAAPLFRMSAYDLQGAASYTFDPFLEEAAKLLPLLVLMLIPAIRRQWSISDCVLIAAATGSGFGLTEHLFRYAGSPHVAEAVGGGWTIPFGRYTLFVPGFFRTLTSWIPTGAYFDSFPISIDYHLAWSAIGGLAVGLAVRRRGKKPLLTALGIYLAISLHHAAGNASHVPDTWLTFVAVPFQYLSQCLGFLVFLTVLLAWWLDQPAQRAGLALGPHLAAETAATSPAIGTFTAAVSRLPWSIGWVYGFDRERRALHAAHVTAAEGLETMRTALAAKRDQLERQLKASESPPLVPAWLTKEALRARVRSALRDRSTVLWLVLIAPSVLFLIVGGFPQTAGLQRLLTSAFLWPLFLLITVANQVRAAWRVYGGMRQLPATARLPIGDDAAVLGLQLACGVGAVVLGGFTLTRVLGGVGATQRLLGAHASDAVTSATPAGTAAAANSANALSPPASSQNSPGANPAPSEDAAPGEDSDATDTPPPAPPKHPPKATPRPMTPQQRADAAAAAAERAAAAATQAAADAQAATDARVQAYRDADSASIRQRTADPSTDPDVAAAQARTRAANDAAQAASEAASEPDDPWNPTTKDAETQATQAAKDAKQAQQDAEDNFQKGLDAQNAAAQQAAVDAKAAEDAAQAQVPAANRALADAQTAADNAATAAERAANPTQAAADDAQKAYEAAKARENQAFYAPDDQQYRDARAAMDAAKAKAEAAQAAADAANRHTSGDGSWPPKKH